MALQQPAMLNLSIDQICEAGVINKGMERWIQKVNSQDKK